jgi:hypothetical protein
LLPEKPSIAAREAEYPIRPRADSLSITSSITAKRMSRETAHHGDEVTSDEDKGQVPSIFISAASVSPQAGRLCCTSATTRLSEPIWLERTHRICPKHHLAARSVES